MSTFFFKVWHSSHWGLHLPLWWGLPPAFELLSGNPVLFLTSKLSSDIVRCPLVGKAVLVEKCFT